MINWESILPKKNKNGLQPFAGNRNALIDVCIENLKQAEARGEICKPLSVDEIDKILSVPSFTMAQAIHNALTGKEG